MVLKVRHLQVNESASSWRALRPKVRWPFAQGATQTFTEERKIPLEWSYLTVLCP